MQNLGKPVSAENRDAAYEWLKKEIGLASSQSLELIGAVASHIEKDLPNQALKAGMESLDLTGAYRLMAILLS